MRIDLNTVGLIVIAVLNLVTLLISRQTGSAMNILEKNTNSKYQ